MKRVGPGRGFWGDPHTLAHFKDNWRPGLTDRRTYDEWAAAGRTRMEDRTRERVRRLLDTHRPQPLSAATDAAVEAILERAEGRNCRTPRAAEPLSNGTAADRKVGE